MRRGEGPAGPAWLKMFNDVLELAPIAKAPPVAPTLVDAPATCEKCGALFYSPTTGRAQSPCWCGGKLRTLPYPIHDQQPGHHAQESFVHDAKGRELKKGDRVLIPCEVRDVQASPEYCNVTVVSLGGRKPDGLRETITLNTNVLLRANDGDDASFEVFVDGDKQYIR
jgi:hypothetical protein